MPNVHHREPLAKSRREISAKVRELRQSRRWTQAELAGHLQLSQNRLSEIERGDGSFTAEQFLLLLRLFNVAATDFVSEHGDRDLKIQNALARLGATHLQESVRVLPSNELDDVHDVVREALLDGSPRIVTAVAPVLVQNAERLNLAKLHAELERLGRERRLAWVVDNTLIALDGLIDQAGSESREWSKLRRRAEVPLKLFLEFISARDQRLDHQPAPVDVLDATVRSRRTLDEVQRSASKPSTRWGIVTSLQPDDFVQALRASRAGR